MYDKVRNLCFNIPSIPRDLVVLRVPGPTNRFTTSDHPEPEYAMDIIQLNRLYQDEVI